MPTQDSTDLDQILRAVHALAPHIEAATDTMEAERCLPEALAQASDASRRLSHGRAPGVWRRTA